MRTKKKYKLMVKWAGKLDDQDLEYSYPLGHQTVADGHFLHGLFNHKVKKELVDRGYDIKTLKFSIDIDFQTVHAKVKFPTLFTQFLDEISSFFHHPHLR